MLDPKILEALKQHTAAMKNDVTFVVQVGEHKKRAELMGYLNGFASVSDKISVEVRETGGVLRSPVSFLLERDGTDTGIRFSGVPGGHEFNSLVLAVLHVSGTPLKLDDSIQSMVKKVSSNLDFQVYVSLSCHNCPDVVQALNQFASLNPSITTEMIDGGLFPDLIEENNIQGVPTVTLNGKPFATGKIDTAVIIEKLLEAYPDILEGGAAEAPSLPVQDVTVIGGGPAGVAAAIYAARKGFKVTMVAERFGGQVKDTMGIENFISVPSTTGPKMTGDMNQHLRDYDITLKEHLRVTSLEKGAVKKLTLSSGETIETRTVIFATGANWRKLGVPGEDEYVGSGVAYCPHCDGPFYKGKDVAVVGGGNSGIEAAIDLAGIVNSVTVFEFMPELKADQVLIDQAEKRDNITIIKNAATKEIKAADGKVNAIEYMDRATEQVHTRDLSGVFIQIGLVPNSQVAEGVVDLSPYKEIIINEKCETSEEGIFACGDVTTVPYKQIIIAAGEGSKAALSAFEYLMLQG